MATFALLHGGGEGGWSWHLVEAALRARGHATVAPDLPSDRPDATLADYATTVVEAVGDAAGPELVVVGLSLGAVTAPMACERTAAGLLVLVSPVVPKPGETVGGWFATTGQGVAHARVLADLGLGGSDDEVYYHDVPDALAAEATRRGRDVVAAAMGEPWPLPAWPAVPTRVLVGRDDRMFPAPWLRGLVRERLGVEAEELPCGHCAHLAAPEELAARLHAMAPGAVRAGRGAAVG